MLAALSVLHVMLTFSKYFNQLANETIVFLELTLFYTNYTKRYNYIPFLDLFRMAKHNCHPHCNAHFSTMRVRQEMLNCVKFL